MTRDGISTHEFYAGDVYFSNWIEECIQNNFVLSHTHYKATTLTSAQEVKLSNLGKRKKYTIVEGMTMYAIAGAQKINKIN